MAMALAGAGKDTGLAARSAVLEKQQEDKDKAELIKKATDILSRFPDNRCCKYFIPYLNSAEGKVLSG